MTILSPSFRKRNELSALEFHQTGSELLIFGPGEMELAPTEGTQTGVQNLDITNLT